MENKLESAPECGPSGAQTVTWLAEAQITNVVIKTLIENEQFGSSSKIQIYGWSWTVRLHVHIGCSVLRCTAAICQVKCQYCPKRLLASLHLQKAFWFRQCSTCRIGQYCPCTCLVQDSTWQTAAVQRNMPCTTVLSKITHKSKLWLSFQTVRFQLKSELRNW